MLCNGASTSSISLTALGGTAPYTYLWSNGAVTKDITNLAAGTYTVTVTDAQGCTMTTSATITEPTIVSLNAVPTNSTCGFANGSINLTVSGGVTPYTYLWSNGITTEDLSGMLAGTSTVTVADANGYTKDTNATVLDTNGPTLSTTQVNVLCNGAATGSIDLTVNGGTAPYTYLWSNGATTQDVSGLLAGAYTVTVTDANGCTKSTSATITEPPALVLSTTQVNVTCFEGSNGSIDLTVSGGVAPYTYLWSNGNTTQDISNLVVGTYTVTVTDANGCTRRPRMPRSPNRRRSLSPSAWITWTALAVRMVPST